jgi:hypothetical protein
MGWLQMERIQLGQVKFLKFEDDGEYIISFHIETIRDLKEFEQHIGYELEDTSRTNYRDLIHFILSNNEKTGNKEITDIVHTFYDGAFPNRKKLDSPIPLEKMVKKGDIYYGYTELSIEDYRCYGLV